MEEASEHYSLIKK